jgi:hypothetical protein
LLLAALALVFSAVGCGAATKLDPGTAKGSYLVAVTGTAGSGATQYQATANIPITIH